MIFSCFIFSWLPVSVEWAGEGSEIREEKGSGLSVQASFPSQGLMLHATQVLTAGPNLRAIDCC